MMKKSLGILAVALMASIFAIPTQGQDAELKLQQGDHVAIIGNTLADRMQHHAWLETYIQAAHPKLNLSFRNLGFPGDEVKARSRSNNFGSPDQWLTKVKADVVLCFFGFNEALRGEGAVAGFKNDLGGMIDGMRAQQYNGKSTPRIVVFSPIAHENLKSRLLPDGSENNVKLAMYTAAMAEVCTAKKVQFVDIFAPTKQMYNSASKPLTMNGIHLLDHGNKALAGFVVNNLFGTTAKSDAEVAKLHAVVKDKSYHWFSRYRVVDGYNVYGGRSKLNWFGQSNADVMMREMQIFDVKTANRDKRIWAVAQGGDFDVKDDNLPEELIVKRNKQGPLKDGAFPYYGAQEAISKMKIHSGMEVNVFASEEMFPRLINPVQVAVDTDSRLWASVWPSYPHWNPTQPRKDALVILPDDNGDGVADDCIIFADELNSVTGFEFWGGGVLVAAPPEIWFLKDTDGDDKADVKIRMLQGVSSADTHHSANAVVFSPGGWLNWSRGIFNVANFETPTQTYRSGSSGVHRFNPRTFQVDFHFPIGPNPHGDVIDRWGYQFASDGTSGTGSYIHIGKGVGNKKWYSKRVRPVPATGILSSSHFPEELDGNFLICNAIGFLGVLQHEVKYNGADITAEEVQPIVVSSDPNFRPSDVEVGGDGALYIADWHNALIGHMQHNMRDPNRDDTHGRVYRVTYKGRDLEKPLKLKGKPIATVCEAFYAQSNSARYRARLELTSRTEDEITAEVGAWVAKLDPADSVQAQAMLECLWVFEEQRIPNLELLNKVLKAEEPRVRAAAIRTLGHFPTIEGWEAPLVAAARDSSPLVRAEAVKSAVNFTGVTAAEVIFEVSARPLDPGLDSVLSFAKGKINVDALVQDAIKSGKPLSKAAQGYVLRSASVADLLKLEKTEAVYEAILRRPNVGVNDLRESIDGLSKMLKKNPLSMLLDLIKDRDANGPTESISGLGKVLAGMPSSNLKEVIVQIQDLAADGKAAETRQIGYAAWIAADGAANNAVFAASKSKAALDDLLTAIPLLSKEQAAELYPDVRSLMFELPPNLAAETTSGFQQAGIKVDFFQPHASDCSIETMAKLKPKGSGIVPQIVMNVPQRTAQDAFALRFTGNVIVPTTGKYTFYTNSDDGSRLYIDKKLVVNNDGDHGPIEKSGSLNLNAGAHHIIVTYFDSGGGDGLSVSWSGPGLKKQSIPADRLAVSGGESLHDRAIRSLAHIPGYNSQKVVDLVSLIKAGKNRSAAISVLNSLPAKEINAKQAGTLVANLLGFLSEIPARYRTGGPAMEAMTLVRSVAKNLPAERVKAIEARLQNLDVRIIALGTVPARMIFDKEQLVVQAGRPVEIRFSNTDHMPHNFAIVQPGSLEEIGKLAEAGERDPKAKERHYIPESNKVLLASRLLEPGDSQALTFEVPNEPGIYPYVCTYPGHWRRMFGALYVVENLEEYQANPEQYLAANPLPIKDGLLKFISRNTDWKFDDLIAAVNPISHGRSYEVGKKLFTVANCVACHKVKGEGKEIGPDLAKIDPKRFNTEHLLRSLVEPSKDIEEKYQSYTFVLLNGKSATGMIVEEDDKVVKLLVDPLAKAAPRVIKKSNIDERIKSKKSIMPEGLASKLTQEEIVDLLAYIFAKGEEKHMLFHKHNH
jgi:putative heme-binding domain-containing protein